MDLDQLHKQLSLLARRYQLRGPREPLALGLTVSEGYALGILTEASSLTMGQLAAELRLSLAAATKIVARLCNLGFTKRAVDRLDKRVQHVLATQKGRKAYSKLQVQFKDHLKNSLEGFTSKDIATMVKGIENINLSIDQWRAKKSREVARSTS